MFQVMRLVLVTGVVMGSAILTPTAGPSTTGTVPDRWLELSPASGPAGTSVEVSGYGFTNENCEAYATLWWDGYEDHRNRVEHFGDSGPSFTEAMTVPSDVRPSDLVLESTCGEEEFLQPGPSAGFRVEPGPEPETPQVLLAPSRGPAGSRVEVTGSGLACDSGLLLWWRDSDIQRQVDSTTGQFRTQMDVPDDRADGELPLLARCVMSDGELTVATFTVITPVVMTTSAPQSSGPTSDVGARPSTSDASDPSSHRERHDDTNASGGGNEGQRSNNSGGEPDEDEKSVAESGSPVHPVRMTDVLPVIRDLHFSAAIVLVLLVLASLVILLIAFPAELFNKTYEKHKVEIHRILRIRREHFPSWLGGVVFVLVSVILSAMLAGGEGAGGNPVAQVLAFLIAIPVVTFAYCLPAELLSRRHSNIHAYLEVLPSALVVAVFCAALSWLLRLDPPYLYGLFVGFAPVRRRDLSDAQDGGAVLAGAICLIALGLVAWLGWGPVHAAAYGPTPTWPAVVADAALFWVFVLAADAAVFALAPLRLLDGATLKKWQVNMWLVPQVVAIGAFLYVLVLRADLNPPGGGITAVLKALVFFGVFCLLSLGFWRYFCWSGRPTRHLADAHEDAAALS